jgi:branched-chain amino acid aminotransferase
MTMKTVSMKAWVNGSIRSAGESSISAFDHGLTVGDGVFETLKVVRGVPFALRRHLHRLVTSARGLGLPDPDLDVVRRAIREALAANAGADVGRLRITWTAGPAPLGSERGDAGGTLIVAVGPSTRWPETESVVVVPWARNERSAVTGLKTTSYAENVVALAHARQRQATEALFADTKGRLSEGTGSNVFVVIGGQLMTPSLACGCLPGVTRALVLEWCGGVEAELPLAALHEADEVFLTSSTRDIVPVSRIDAHEVPLAPGSVTAKARQLFGERAAADLDP